MPSWKTVQSKRQLAQKTKLGIFVLALVLGLLILAQIIKATQIAFSSWKLQTTNQKKISWNGDFNINLLIRSEIISLISFSPQNQEVTIITIPDSLFFEVSRGFGKWQLRSIYELGEGQKGLGGNKLLKDSVASLFALPIDGVVEGDLVNLIKEDRFSIFSVLSNLKSELTLMELIRLQMGVSKVRFDKVNQIDLKPGILEKSILADGSEVLIPDPVKLDSIISNMADPLFTREHKTIAIFNSTNHPQLAQRAARLITNIGGDVIIVSNSRNKFDKTVISGEQSKILEYLKQIFEASGTIDPKDEDLASSRAQINLFLGEDYFNSK